MLARDQRAVAVLLQARIHTDPRGIARELVNAANGCRRNVPEHRRLWAVVADAIIVCSRCSGLQMRARYNELLLRNEVKHLPSGVASLLVSALAKLVRGRPLAPYIASALVDPVHTVHPRLRATFSLQHGNVRYRPALFNVSAVLRAHLVGHGPCTVQYLNAEGAWVPFSRQTSAADMAGLVLVTSLPEPTTTSV